MIKLTWAEIRNQEFHKAFKHVYSQRLPMHTACDLQLLAKKIEEQLKLANEMANKLLSEHCTKNDDGSYLPKPELEKEFQAAQDEYLKRYFSLKIRPISREQLSGIDISAGELELLSPLFESVPVEASV